MACSRKAGPAKAHASDRRHLEVAPAVGQSSPGTGLARTSTAGPLRYTVSDRRHPKTRAPQWRPTSRDKNSPSCRHGCAEPRTSQRPSRRSSTTSRAATARSRSMSTCGSKRSFRSAGGGYTRSARHRRPPTAEALGAVRPSPTNRDDCSPSILDRSCALKLPQDAVFETDPDRSVRCPDHLCR